MKKIIKQLLVFFLIYYASVRLLFRFDVLDYDTLLGSFVSGIINILNAALSIAAFKLGYNQSNKKFLIYIFGGMVFRLFFILMCVFLVLFLMKLSVKGFIFSLFIVYFVVLILEVNFYRLKIPEKKI